MKIAVLHCPTGISGNMFLGALADAGLEWDMFVKKLQNNLPLTSYSLTKKQVVKNGIAATLVTVACGKKKAHRHLQNIIELLDNSTLPAAVISQSRRVFRRLAQAEAAVHKCSVEEVHFHEVGAVDAIIDIVGSVLGLYLMGIEKLYSHPLPLGTGFLNCDHGTLPVPAPATLKLMEGFPVAENPPDCRGELTTPTGAALVTTLARFTQGEELLLAKVGFGAGSRDLPLANTARILIGEENPGAGQETEKIFIIETNIDDMNPEFYGYLMDRLFSAGALDVFYTPVYMKANRPGTLLTVLARPKQQQPLLKILQSETTSLGFRFREESRIIASRQFLTVQTSHGSVNVKISSFGEALNIAPEYKDCVQLARQAKIPLKTVYDEAKALARKHIHNTGKS